MIRTRLRLARTFFGELRGASGELTESRLRVLARLPEWIRTQSRGSSLDDEGPWITFVARDRLAALLTPDSTGFEFGSGGSTIYLSRRTGRLTTTEHDPKWAASVLAHLKVNNLTNVTIAVCPPTAGPAGEAQSSDPLYDGLSFADYVRTVDAFEDASLDFVFIDGRARAASFEHARSKVRPGGFVLLDNSERPEYEVVALWCVANGWTIEHFFGPGPYVSYFWRTSIFTRPLT